jgi:hypothetical protein
MTQLLHKYTKCSECGREDFMWGAIIGDTFICHTCLKHLDVKLDDMEEEARNKAYVPITDKLRLK